MTETVTHATQTATQSVPTQTPPTPGSTTTTEAAAQTVQDAAKESLEATTQTANSTVDTARNAAQTATGAAQKAVDDTTATVHSTVDTPQKAADDIAGTANQTLAPVADTAENTIGTVTQTAAPLVGQLSETAGTTTALGDTLAPATGLLPPLVGNTVENTLGSTGATNGAPAPESTSGPRGSAQQAEASPAVDPALPTPAEETYVRTVAPAPATASRAPRVSALTAKKTSTPATPEASVTFTIPSAPVGDLHVTPNGGVAMPSSHSHAPLPDIPSGPLTALFSASASAGGGALVILLAALAAALTLAAPGLGRRLRPRSAPWPLPTLHLSLERPG